MGPRATFATFLDRTAVLALGIVAGFAVGLSFNTAGREQVAGWLFPDAAPPPALHPRRTVTALAGIPELHGPIDARVLRRVGADGHVRVGVFGDSFGNGLWSALYDQLPRGERYDVLQFSKEATGFTRYRQIDLEVRARRQVESQPIDVAVMSFGANDVQPIFAEGHLWPLMSDGWKRIIGERVGRFVATVRSTGAAAFWVGLPIMRDPQMDAQIEDMNAFYADRMRRLGVPFVDTRPASLDPQARYNAHLPDPKTGRPALMRESDGIHMNGVGYRRLTAPLAERIRAYAALIRQEAGKPEPTPTPRGAAR